MDDELFNFDEILARLKIAANVSKDTALAVSLGLRQGSISGAKLKNKLPPAWLLKASKTFNVSMDWLVYGEGPMKRREAAEPPQERTTGASTPVSGEFGELRQECRELKADNRELIKENRELMKDKLELTKENGDLRVELTAIKTRAESDQALPNESQRKAS